MKYLLPQGIGDSVWALHKIQSINAKLDPGGPIDVFLTCSERNILQDRALDFLRRFDFVDSVSMRMNYGLLNNYGSDRPPFTPGGYWDYIEDGMYDFKGEQYCVLIPNAPLERGIRLEQWLPQYPIDWDIFSRFRITTQERAYGAMVKSKIGPYAVFYPGPLHGNTLEGHNRLMLWKPAEWIALGERIHHGFGLSIIVVGAEYDHDYYTHMLLPRLNGNSTHWIDLIGRTSIGELFSVTSNAKFLISYQAGVGIVSTYLRVPTAMWWRPRGDSISQSGFLSFENEMSTAWVPPAILESKAYLPMLYGQSGVEYILEEIRSRGWVE
jgi:hypothetical protein